MYKNAQTQFINVEGTKFAYRELGLQTGMPLILLNHLSGNLDNFDPAIVDELASKHRVITFDNRGVGASEGITPTAVSKMAEDVISFIKTMGYKKVDLFGFSLGGFTIPKRFYD